MLGENLALLLGTDDVLLLPQNRDFALDRQVEVDVTRFDVDNVGNAVLDAKWWVYGRDGDKLLRSGRSTISEPASHKVTATTPGSCAMRRSSSANVRAHRASNADAVSSSNGRSTSMRAARYSRLGNCARV